MADIKFTDNSRQVLAELESNKHRALTAVGIAAQGHAKATCPVDTGRLRGSISHAVAGDSAFVGTNVEYAPYVELGTRKMAPRHFLKNAAEGHRDEYLRILNQYMKGK